MAMLGSTIRRIRLEQGLSQERLALRAGTRQATISRLERGLEEPSLARFAELMGVMGHRVELTIERLAGERPDTRDPETLLRESVSWNHVATELEIAAQGRAS
jgi:putative transcriptional regulator